MTNPITSDKGYQALQSAEYWCVVGTGGFVFRFGPYSGPECGKIISGCVADQISMTVVVNCGQEFDWDLARDLRGDLSKMNFIQRWLWRRRQKRMLKMGAEPIKQQPKASDHQS